MANSRILDRFLSSLEQCAANGDLSAWYTGIAAFLQRRSSSANELDSALLTELLRQSEIVRAHLRSRPARLWWSYLIERVFGLLCRDVSPLSGSVVDYSIASKARLLLDHMHGSYRRPSRDLKQQSESVFRLSGDEPSTVTLLSDLSRISMVWPTAITIDPMNPRAQVESLERNYLRENVGFSGSSRVPTLQRVQSQLLDNEVIIDYVAPSSHNIKNEVYISVITKAVSATTQADMKSLPEAGTLTMMSNTWGPIDFNRLTAMIAGCRNAIERGDDDAATLQMECLYDALIRPVERLGIEVRDYSHWIISPHGAMHAIPWNAVINIGRHPRGARTSVSVVPSIGVWSALVARVSKSPPSFSAFVDPNEDLEGAAAEGDFVSAGLKGYRGEVYSGARATAEAFRERAHTTSVVHIAGHGGFPDHEGLDSHALLLASGDRDPNPVLASELRDMDFAAELVTLNICDGASYRVGPGSEPYGLVAGFLAGGCRNVLGTLWPVGDSAALEFAQHFYLNVLEEGPAAAARGAAAALGQRELLKDWACYVMVGPGRMLPSLDGIRSGAFLGGRQGAA